MSSKKIKNKLGLHGIVGFTALGFASIAFVIFSIYQSPTEILDQAYSNVLDSIASEGTDLDAADTSRGADVQISVAPTSTQYAHAGEDKVNVLNLNFAAGSTSARLREVKFKMSGMECSDVEEVYLITEGESGDGGGKNFDGECNDGYLNFDSIYQNFHPGENDQFGMYLDFSENARVGQIAFFSLEKLSDINFSIGGKRVYLQSAGEVASSFVSIVGNKIVY